MELQRQERSVVRRLVGVWACLLLAALPSTAPLAAAEYWDRPVRAFIDDSRRGIGAERTTCPSDVIEQVRTHGMNAVCARFEGSFERFAVRWGLQMIQAAGPEDGGPASGFAPVSPQTEWERNGQIHDRIYLIGESAIGVRFAAGDLLMVW